MPRSVELLFIYLVSYFLQWLPIRLYCKILDGCYNILDTYILYPWHTIHVLLVSMQERDVFNNINAAIYSLIKNVSFQKCGHF